MKKMLGFLLILFLSYPQLACPIFRPVEGVEDSSIKRISVSWLTPNLIGVASDNSLYLSEDRGINFKKIRVFTDETIQHIFFDDYLAGTFYIATSRNLYKGDLSERVQKIFSVPEEERIYTAAKHKGTFYVGSSSSVYYAAEELLNWKKMQGLNAVSVYHIEPAGEKIYLAASTGVYIIYKNNSIVRVFVIRESQQENIIVPNIVIVDEFDDNRVWLGTTRGLFVSGNKGQKWDKVYIGGIDNLAINSIMQDKDIGKDSLYLGTSKGFFKVDLKNKSSNQILEGLYASDVRWAEISLSGKIYLATAKGLFESNYNSEGEEFDSFQRVLFNEPCIEEVQQAALKYNEVNPGKIRKWRNRLKYRALLPEVSLDYDKTIYGGYGASYQGTLVGPRDWGVNLKWDVGDLIWNTYEDDIDVRSRLTTQLRLDILDEINRVFYERLRLKHEIVTGSFSQEEMFQKQLRLGELTAILNGYTGGYFSKRAEELNDR